MSKNKVNVELNMTPFIGLFALLVVMLLLTAVWNHIAVLSTDTSATTASESPLNGNRANLNVTILSDRVEMSENEKAIDVSHINGKEIDKMRMVQVLSQWKQKYPTRSDVVLNTENTVTYDQLIVVFDTLVGNEWPDVGVNTQ